MTPRRQRASEKTQLVPRIYTHALEKKERNALRNLRFRFCWMYICVRSYTQEARVSIARIRIDFTRCCVPLERSIRALRERVFNPSWYFFLQLFTPFFAAGFFHNCIQFKFPARWWVRRVIARAVSRMRGRRRRGVFVNRGGRLWFVLWFNCLIRGSCTGVAVLW